MSTEEITQAQYEAKEKAYRQIKQQQEDERDRIDAAERQRHENQSRILI